MTRKEDFALAEALLGKSDVRTATGYDVHKFNEGENRKDDRTKLQATQQSELIDQRAKDKGPKDFEDDFDLGAFDIGM